MKELLEPVFSLLTGVGFLLFLAVAMKLRARLSDLGGRLVLFGYLAFPLSFLLFSFAGRENTLNKASDMILAGGGVVMLAMILIGGGLYLRQEPG